MVKRGVVLKILIILVGGNMFPGLMEGAAAAADLLGDYMQKESNEKIARNQENLQREFAQHGIRWKVEDAKAAGLHPLYAIGASTPSYTPITVGETTNAFHRMGQGIRNAAAATMSPEERQVHELTLAETQSRIKQNDAIANYYNSEAARSAQQAVSQKPIPTSVDKTSIKPNSRTIHAPAGTLRTSETTPSEVVESEYGDLAQEIYGASRMVNDLLMNFWDAVEKVNPWWLKAYREDSKVQNSPEARRMHDQRQKGGGSFSKW